MFLISFFSRSFFILKFSVFLFFPFHFLSQSDLSDTQYYKTLHSIDNWNYYLRNNLDSLKIDAISLLNECNNLNEPFAVSVAKRSLGSYFIRSGYIKKGQEYLNASLKYFETIKDATLESETLSEIGISYYLNKDYYSAKIYFERSLKCASRASDETISFMAELNLAQVYNSLGDQSKSTSFAKHYLRQCLKNNKFESASNAYAFLGTIYLDKNLKLSKEYFDMSFKFSKKTKSKIQISRSCNNLGVWYVENNDFDLAEFNFRKALKYRVYVHSPLHIFESYFNLAELFLLTNRDDESIEMYHKSLSVSRLNNLYDSEIEALDAIVLFYKRKNNYKTALLYSDTLRSRMNFVSNFRIDEFNYIISSFPRKSNRRVVLEGESFLKTYEVKIICVLFIAFIIYYVFASKKIK